MKIVGWLIIHIFKLNYIYLIYITRYWILTYFKNTYKFYKEKKMENI